MKAVFADTFFYLALLDTDDDFHARAIEFAESYQGRVITSRWVLAETANGLGQTFMRRDVADFIDGLEGDGVTKIIGASDEYFRRGLELYRKRPDKEWSLTDCISFCIMGDEDLTEALTRDHHFAQAGFIPLFADPQ